ncbi:T9SS type A sorting domain-containing protein [Hymenobacter guriensis]|uniref:T9SS type A sorting domain-containing protein n=1 Tax=Hymenobacter guriensis TaxID=2793065 RepID=A0ABS0KW48_9BACT|nr:T9SS type A sorting domain-containing protein [Hymenobacter guriensis]MBG8552098.1 T9SS type A sorting domain-containing protein [Hymenobacter guriensis]
MKTSITHALPLGLLLTGIPLGVVAQAPCNSITNGDFDTQVSAPAGYISNVKSNAGSTNELASWEATNYTTPDYYATNAPNGMETNPLTVDGSGLPQFTPYNYNPAPNAINGAIGLYTYNTGVYGTQTYIEYVTQKVQLQAGKEYYATMQVARSRKSNTATHVGMELTPTSPRNDTYTVAPNSSGYTPRLYYATAPANLSIHSNAPVSSTQWTRINGLITPPTTTSGLVDYYVNIGNFQQSTPMSSPSGPRPLSYHYIDAVGIYEIATAGPGKTTCPYSPVTIGSGCRIPEATYTWSLAGSDVEFPNSPQITVQPTTTTTYTLTVTLPTSPATVRTSSVTVTVQPPQLIAYPTSNNTCSKTITYQIMNFNPAYTYTLSNISNGLSLQQANPLTSSAFTLQGASSSSGGSFTLTLSGCGTVSNNYQVNFATPAPTGYFNCGYSPGYGSPVSLNTYQSLGITNAQGADVGVFVTNPSYYYSITLDNPAIQITNTTGSSIHFILKPGQGTQVTATALNSPCPIVGRYAFYAPSSPYGYRYSVSPNPVSSELTVTAGEEDASAAPFSAELYDSLGHKVKAQASNRGKALLDVRKLPAGLYTLRSGSGKNVQSERIQITH